MGTIAENIIKVCAKIAAAAERSGRDADDITLVAVTKTRTPEEMAEAVEVGITDVGENKVQEFEKKYPLFTQLNWHFIGHLQRNKVKYIIGKTNLIHSVDSLRLAEEIDRRAAESNDTVDVLVQVNAAREESKFGVSADEACELVRLIAETCLHIRVKGLMCIAPAVDNPEDARGIFRTVKALFDDIKANDQSERTEMKWLSMGMTHDYEIAIEEGANIVRVGTGIFGERNYVAQT
jgi:pyridoxal phosphate enzyme (YggS family)